MGRPTPQYPTLFAKYDGSLIGLTCAVGVDQRWSSLVIFGCEIARIARASASQLDRRLAAAAAISLLASSPMAEAPSSRSKNFRYDAT